MNFDIKLHKLDLPDDLAFSDKIAIDCEFMGLNVERDRLCLVQISNGNNDAHIVQLDKENYNAPNNKRAGNHLGVSVINEDGTDYGSSRLSENLINNGATGGTASGSGEFNWGNRHSNDRGGTTTFRHSQLLYFDDVQLNSAQWDYLEHYFKVMYG